MRPDRRRTKKLIVAFHFQQSNQAAWKCDQCRKSGLQRKRRCGWVSIETPSQDAAVWARGKLVTQTCPVSYVTAESNTMVEEFHAWKLFGHCDFYSLPARTVEALITLENELRMEMRDAQG